jgi:uncharacterized MAPEG superfamily protein
MTFPGQPALQLYAIASAILVALLYGLATVTGTVRSRRQRVVNREDVGVYKGASVVEVEHPDVQRVKRAHLNLIENAVPFFVLGLLYALTRPGATIAGALFFTFVGSRLLHAVFYVTERQPLRTAMYLIGLIVNLVLLALVVWAAI